MATFTAVATYRVTLTTTIEATGEQEAWSIAEALDGSEFKELADRGFDDWQINEVFKN